MNNSRKNILWHALVWAILFLIPFLIDLTGGTSFKFPLHAWLRLTEVCAIFYLNYLFLIPKLFFTHKRKLFLLANIGAALLLNFAIDMRDPPPPFPRTYGQDHGQHFEEHRPPPHNPAFGFFIGSLSLSFLATVVAVAIRLTERMTKDEQQRQLLETEHLRSELSYLKLQVSPHFLFNTLNNIYSLVGQDPPRAQSSIHHLSKLLRYLLYDTNAELVPIRGEVTFLQSYLELMRLRLAPHVHVTSSFELMEENAPIAPLLLLPLVENAFKHGVDPQNQSSITIHLAVAEGLLEFLISNTNYPKPAMDQSGSGIGLVNLTKRLELIYPGRFQYKSSIVNDLYSAQLSIQLR